MSVINRMLKDLDERRQPHDSTYSSSAVKTPSIVSTTREMKKNPFALALLCFVCLMVGLFTYIWYWQPPSTKAEQTEAKILPPAHLSHSTTEPKTWTVASPAHPQPKASSTNVQQPQANTSYMKKVDHPLSRFEQVTAMYQRAQTLLDQGQTSSAVLQLYKVLQRDVGFHQARLTLATVLLESGQVQDANRVLIRGLQLAPKHIGFVMLKARILIDEQKYLAALHLLEASPPPLQAHPDYYALLAAVEEKLNRPIVAAMWYRQMLKVDPHNGDWWVGLGIALDTAGKTKAAITAYHEAEHNPTTSSQLRAYVEQRINAIVN